MDDDTMRGDWSVVMTAWSGDWTRFHEVAAHAFGREGLDTFSVALRAREHLPAELADGLSLERARDIAAQLTEAGANIEVEMTSELSALRHRAPEVWASVCTDTFCFTEFAGLITTLGAVNARENLAHFEPGVPSWKVEWGLNHMHVGIGSHSLRDAIDEGERIAWGLAEALHHAYPKRAFTILHDPGSEVSFWQTSPESPKAGCASAGKANASTRVWCQRCSKMQEFERTAQLDPLFPNAEWGTCKVCGDEVLVSACERLITILPEEG